METVPIKDLEQLIQIMNTSLNQIHKDVDEMKNDLKQILDICKEINKPEYTKNIATAVYRTED